MLWFQEWFNSPYYHILYNNRNESEAELFIGNLVPLLKISPHAKVLDIACGKGRHSKTLAKFCFDVTGIDLSEQSIIEAKKFETKNLHFDVWDMRHPYRINEFDCVFNLFSSFGYFDDEKDDYACIQSFYKSMKKSGILILDYINVEWLVKNLKAKEIIPRGEIQFHIKKRIEDGFIKKKIEFLVNGEDYSYEEKLKMINRYKFTEMLTASGFEIKHTFGNYNLDEFNPSASPRLIFIAEKNDGNTSAY